ncbi:uncharacterized protein LOC143222756 [Tachypleus tridentatus]|uniref:uncharacterized protein LOC143222756 n=1 Tax=Tachypleus tridentatus TaxID=6853 RepID=UPI003FD29D06
MSVVMETIGHDPLASHPKSPGLSALMAACQRNDDAEVRMLLQKRHHLVATRDRNGKTALHYCTENRDLTCADLILKSEPSLLNEQDEEGYTALHLAVINGNELMTKYLIHKGADVNIVDSEMHSCIHWATVCGELECLDILIDAGGNPATPDIHGAYPIHYASQMCGPNSEMGNNMELGFAVLSKLLARGVSVLVRDQDGRQPLLWAASAGSSDAIVALVNAGAVVTGEDKDGLTALHCAASRGHVDCVETLISLCGAEVDTIDSNGCTALFYAVTLGHADCTQLLLQYGAQPNRQDRKGRTAAHCGASKGQLETLKILRSNGGNLWLTNVRGDLPLHEAIQSGRKDLVLWLLSLNPDAVNAQNLNGRTALHIAALTDNVEMCKILLDSRANINAVLRTSKGQLMTPLDATIRRGNKSCAKYLQLHGAVPASRLLENHELSRSFIGRLEEAPGQRITPSEESLSSPFVNKMNPYSLESSFDEIRMRSESVQTDQSKIDTQDADVQVLRYTPRLQTDENVTKSKDIERQYYLKESIEKTSTSKDDGKEHRMRQAIITNVYITASDDNKKGRKGRNRQESEEEEASDEDSVADSHIERKKRRSPRRKNVYRDDVDSDDIEEYENNENVVRRRTKKSRRNKSYKQRIVHIDEDEEANTGQIAEQTDKRSHKDGKGRQIRATSENDEDENKSESEERDTQRKKRHVQNRKGYSEEEESLEDDYDDESRKMSKIKIKKYYEINEKNKATEIKDGKENHITSKRENIVLKTKLEDNERNTKYNIHKETEEKNNRQKEPNKDNDAKKDSRQNEQNNNETGTHVKTDNNKSDKDELEETNILETGNHAKNDFNKNDTDDLEETNIPETGNHDKTDFNENATGKLEETNILETGKRFKDQLLNEHKTVNSQTSPPEEEENHKHNHYELVGMTETSSKVTNKYTTDTEKSGFLRNSKSELILKT